MIRVIGWETTKEAIDQNVADSRKKDARQRKSPLVKKFESEHAHMRHDLNREIERKIERVWLDEVCRPII